ncbi:MAG: ABC-type transport auxiliary lipoprotein family protein, partial [Candidatus Acidiferrum sp.]
SSLYREDRIVYGTESEGMGLYEYQRWAEPPTEMIREILLRELRGSRRFSEVYPLRSVIHGDYLLRGRLYDFKEISGNSGVVARVTFELELRDNKTFKTVWSYNYHQDEPVAGKDAPSVVAALDKNIGRGTQEAIAGIEQYFAQNPPQPPAGK